MRRKQILLNLFIILLIFKFAKQFQLNYGFLKISKDLKLIEIRKDTQLSKGVLINSAYSYQWYIYFSISEFTEDDDLSYLYSSLSLCLDSQSLGQASIDSFTVEQDTSIIDYKNQGIEKCFNGSYDSPVTLGQNFEILITFQVSLTSTDDITDKITLTTNLSQTKFQLLLIGISKIKTESRFNLIEHKLFIYGEFFSLGSIPSQIIVRFPKVILNSNQDLTKLNVQILNQNSGTIHGLQTYSDEETISITFLMDEWKFFSDFFSFALIFQEDNFKTDLQTLGNFQIDSIDEYGSLVSQSDQIQIKLQKCSQSLQIIQSTQSIIIGQLSEYGITVQIDNLQLNNYRLVLQTAKNISIMGELNKAYFTFESIDKSLKKYWICSQFSSILLTICDSSQFISQNINGQVKFSIKNIFLKSDELKPYQMKLILENKSDSSCYSTDILQIQGDPHPTNEITIQYSEYNSRKLTIQFLTEIDLLDISIITLEIPSNLQLNSLTLYDTINLNKQANLLEISPNTIQISNFTESKVLTKLNWIRFSFKNAVASSALYKLQANNNFKLTISTNGVEDQTQGVINLQINPDPLFIEKSYLALEIPNENIMSYSVALTINFKILFENFPRINEDYQNLVSPSEFHILLPPQLEIDLTKSLISIKFEGAFNEFCYEHNQFKIEKINDPLNKENTTNRYVVIIFCTQPALFYQKSSNSYNLLIQGVIMPKYAQQTDRLIIQMKESNQNNTNQKIKLYFTSEHEIFDIEELNKWIFQNEIQLEFKHLFYKYQQDFNCSSYDEAIMKNNKIDFIIENNIQFYEGSVLKIVFDKQNFQLFENDQSKIFNNLLTYQQKLLICSFQSKQGVSLNQIIQVCMLQETEESFSIKIQIFPSSSTEILEWDRKYISVQINEIAFIPIIRTQTNQITFTLSTMNDEQINQSIYQIQNEQYFQLTILDYLQNNQSIEEQNNDYYFDYVLFLFESFAQIENLNLILAFNKNFNMNQDSQCLIEICGIKNIQINFILNLNNQSITIPNVKEQLQPYIPQNFIMQNLKLKITRISIDLITSNSQLENLEIKWSVSSLINGSILTKIQSLPIQLKCQQEECQSCVNNGYNCIECKQGYHLFVEEKKCVLQCPSHTVLDQATNSCRICLTQQQNCISCHPKLLKTCSQCAQNYFLSLTNPSYCYLPPSSSPLKSLLPSSLLNKTSEVSSSLSSTNEESTVSSSSNQLNKEDQIKEQKQSQDQNEKQKRGIGGLFGEIKTQARGLFLTLTIPISLIAATITKLINSCLRKNEGNKNVSIQIGQSSPEKCGQLQSLQQQHQQNKSLIKYQRREYGHFSWIATLLFFMNLGDIIEIPYILFMIMSETQSIPFTLSLFQAEQIPILVYLVVSFFCYLYCFLIIIKPMVFDQTALSIFYIFSINNNRNSINNRSYNKNHTQTQDQIQKEDFDQKLGMAQNKNGQNKKSECTLMLCAPKQIINFITRCFIAFLGKAFCMIYTNAGDVSGWFFIQVKEQLKLFRAFHHILCIHTMFNILSGILITTILTQFPFTSFSIYQQKEIQIQYSFLLDILIFKIIMSFICYANCLHIQALIQTTLSPISLEQQTPITSTVTANSFTLPQSGIYSTYHQVSQLPSELKCQEQQNKIQQQYYQGSHSPYQTSCPSPITTSM
uniref:MTBXp n=1 Tax=Tetrahymena borealis TaxID=5893 RepID=A0A513X596_TETBO|nr:MTBXp [Tetrahymena borealis]